MKKKLALTLTIIFSISSSMHAFSVRSALNVITYPFTATYRSIKKAGPRVVRFCKNNPEDALMLGIIGAALIVGLVNKAQERRAFPRRNDNAGGRKYPQIPQRPKINYYPDLTERQVAILLNKVQTNNPTEENCSICFDKMTENYVKTTCDHLYHRDCLAKWFRNDEEHHTVEHPQFQCPDVWNRRNGRCYKKQYACPICRKKYCIVK